MGRILAACAGSVVAFIPQDLQQSRGKEIRQAAGLNRRQVGVSVDEGQWRLLLARRGRGNGGGSDRGSSGRRGNRSGGRSGNRSGGRSGRGGARGKIAKGDEERERFDGWV